MAKDRLELQELLERVLGARQVYYQPPANVRMAYPAIVYSRRDMENRFADNGVYHQEMSYTVTVIDPDPDSEIVQRVSRLPRCRFDRHFTSGNLNHDVFTIYF